MSKRGTGAVFCLTAGILFAARYVSAAIYLSHASTWSEELFTLGLQYQGNGLLIASVLSLIVGAAYLILAEMDGRKQR